MFRESSKLADFSRMLKDKLDLYKKDDPKIGEVGLKILRVVTDCMNYKSYKLNIITIMCRRKLQ